MTGLTEIQLSGMSTALINGGSSLLHIGIQLMPYAIAFTIIFIIFGLIKNWSKLKNKWSDDVVILKDEKEVREFRKYYDKNGNLKKKYDINYSKDR